MLSRVAVETVATGTAPVPLVMFKVGTLPRDTSPMGSNAPTALNATHSAATGHANRHLDLDRLPRVICP